MFAKQRLKSNLKKVFPLRQYKRLFGQSDAAEIEKQHKSPNISKV